MKILDRLQDIMTKFIDPITAKVTSNKSITAIQRGMMATMPLTIGIAVVTILANLPITPWMNFLQATGLYATGQMMMMAVLNLMALYIVVAISYSYAQAEGDNPLTVMLLSLACFICLMPQMIVVGEGRAFGLEQSKLGSDGIFVGMLVAIIIPKMYHWLKSKNITLKLPESVPPMVTDSLSPIFIAMILFLGVTAVRQGFSMTSYGDIFVFINTVIGKPIMKFGTSPWAVLAVYTIANVLWFFGVHPSAVTSVYRPVSTAAATACAEAFLAGEALPYAPMLVLGMAVISGGTGNTLGLCISCCFAKSEKFKAIGKASIVPNIFNINEPILFGTPLILNPVFFIPMVLSALVPGSILIFIMNAVGNFAFDPTLNLPWVTPTVIQAFAKGGLFVFGLMVLYTVIDWLIYLPFFRIADKKAYEEEQAALAEKNA